MDKSAVNSCVSFLPRVGNIAYNERNSLKVKRHTSVEIVVRIYILIFFISGKSPGGNFVENILKGEYVMDVERFNDVVKKQIQRCEGTLIKKATEYATEDRLHNFNVSAKLLGVSPEQALAGMMTKHTVSVYDMCASDEVYDIGLWDEKITDHINYLLILRALVEGNHFHTKQKERRQ